MAARSSKHSSDTSEDATSRADQFAQEASRAAVEASQHAAHANIIHARAWADQYFEAVRGWADEVATVMARAIDLQDVADSVDPHMVFDVRAALSGLIDRGRWYFPNQWHDEVGLHKEAAFRGIRQPILDHLCEAYVALGRKQACGPELRAALVKAQRCFVS